MTIPIYCLTYNNPTRRQRMSARFDKLKLSYEFVEGVNPYDPSVVPNAAIIERAKQLDRWKPHSGYGCLLGHFKAIEKFLNQSSDIGIVCEDDIFLRKDFAEELPIIEANFKRQQLDVLMLGYMHRNDMPARVIHNKPLKSPAFSYHNYDSDPEIWGCQMYMLSRKHAEFLWDNYGPHTDYKLRALVDTSLEQWISDCLITKTGNRAMISPMIAVEEGVGSHAPNQPFHSQSFSINFDTTIHI